MGPNLDKRGGFMKKSLVKSKELEEKLKAVGAAKAPIFPKSRRYTDKEIELILEGAEQFGRDGVSALCRVREWTISKWKSRREPKSLAVAADHHEGYHPHWQKALDLWRSKPGLGPAQIANQMKRDGVRISTTTVRTILEENGYTPPKAKLKPERVFRYEAARPRELVHMDFKHFYIHKQKAFLLLMQDDYSRFLCGHRLTDSENIDAVIAVFEDSVAKYGRMQTIMTDAGSAFYSWNGINRFQKLIAEEYGIDHIKASSPRSNGKVESVNKQIEKELLKVKEFSSLDDAAMGIAEWIEFYNFERTHMGLSGKEVPADRYLYGWDKRPPETPKAENVWEDVLKVALTKVK